MTLTLREPRSDEFATWRQLYDQYCRFYETDLPDAKAERVWGWVQDPEHVVEGRFLCRDGEVIGLCHFREVPLPLDGSNGGFIDDLFVDPVARGEQAGEFVARELMMIGRQRGWVSLQWLTGDDNYRGRSIYDKFAKRTLWITYEADLT